MVSHLLFSPAMEVLHGALARLTIFTAAATAFSFAADAATTAVVVAAVATVAAAVAAVAASSIILTPASVPAARARIAISLKLFPRPWLSSCSTLVGPSLV